VGYWDAKLDRNMERDVEQTQRLEAAGWTVLRFWGHEIDRDPEGCAQRVTLAHARRAQLTA
jgi:DNA mismatch endonuclease (patch repair protein)